MGLIALVLLVSFVAQVRGPKVADWSLFSFYDPGTTLKGDMLLAKGYVPTVDFGYTHGLVSLLVGRAGFAVLGRTPRAYFLLTLGLEMVMAWPLARLLIALRLGRGGILIFLISLPIAIMPVYLTLTHPLEALLLLLALADHAEGRRSRALAILTLCIFVKPSMAYVYGLVLVGLIVLSEIQNSEFRIQNWGERIWGIGKQLLPAAAVMTVCFAGLSVWYGTGPVIHTMLPITGAKTYASTGFGFLQPSGRSFWIQPEILKYVRTSLGVWLMIVAVSIPAMISAAWQIVLGPKHSAQGVGNSSPLSMRVELLFVFCALHLAFLFGFYGWPGSWTYYSYLPMLTLALLVSMVPLRRWAWAILVLLLLAAHVELAGTVMSDWTKKQETPAGLWVENEMLAEWDMVKATVAGKQALVMTNGWPADLPANMEMPDAWFPEPGIPTAREIARIQKQIERADCVVLWQHYHTEKVDTWDLPEYAALRPGFKIGFKGKYFTIMERGAAATTTDMQP